MYGTSRAEEIYAGLEAVVKVAKKLHTDSENHIIPSLFFHIDIFQLIRNQHQILLFEFARIFFVT